MTSDAVDVQVVEFKDKRTRLMVAGLFQGFIGAGFLLFSVLYFLMYFVFTMIAKDSSPPINMLWLLLVFLEFFLLGVWFLTMGFGTIGMRRWARALSLVVCWTWLVSGGSGLVFNLFYLPDMYRQMAEAEEMPESVSKIMMYGILFFMAILFIVIPSILIMLYRGPDTKATCEHYNPKPCWTDFCPLPVLAVSFFFILWTMVPIGTMLMFRFYPFFGLKLAGIPAIIMVFSFAALNLLLAWGTYRLKLWAWWAALLLMTVQTVSYAITFSFMKLEDYYRMMSIPGQDIEKLSQLSAMPSPSVMLAYSFLFLFFLLGYLIYVKKYFSFPEQDVAPIEA